MALIGTAGWSIPAQFKDRFADSGSHLARYAGHLRVVEINSSFHRPHQRKTYERWAATVPAGFRFSVKVPRSITQEKRLQDCGDLLARFGDEVGGLGAKLGVLLVQLPPNLIYDAKIAAAFFKALRRIHPTIACEPRNASWFEPRADAALVKQKIVRVAADPPRAANSSEPGGWRDFAYWRLHGSPKVYYSDYPKETLEALAPKLQAKDWCIFDNTTLGAALGNALAVARLTA